MRRLIDWLLCRPSQKEKQLVTEIRAKSDYILEICQSSLVDVPEKEILFKIAVQTAQGLGRLEGIYGMVEDE